MFKVNNNDNRATSTEVTLVSIFKELDSRSCGNTN